MKQLALDLARSVAPTLDNFVAGRNAELLHALRQLAAGGAGERFVCIWGESGSGRSHLLRAFTAAASAAGRDAAYLDGASMGEQAVGAECVAVDDVHRLSAPAQAALFNLYNMLREGKGVLITAADAPPPQLQLRRDLVTRLAWGLVYRVHALTDDEKAGALRERAAALGFLLPDDVCAYLLVRVDRDMRALLAMLEALDRHSLETRRPITVPLAREVLQAMEREQ
jgi:DnaA family protein